VTTTGGVVELAAAGNPVKIKTRHNQEMYRSNPEPTTSPEESFHTAVYNETSKSSMRIVL